MNRFASLLLTAALFAACSGASSTTPPPAMSWTEAVGQAETVSYDHLVRNVDQYVGALVLWKRATVDTVNDLGEPTHLTVDPPSLFWDVTVKRCACAARQRPGDIVGVVVRVLGLESDLGEPIPAVEIVALQWIG